MISMQKRIRRELIQHKSKLAQIWIETVIYTLIAFVLIGAVLAFVKPKIDEMQDKAIIEQSINLLKDLDAVVTEITQGGSGNKRQIEMSIKKGELIIDSVNDEFVFEIESRFEYSEPGVEVQNGNLVIITTESGDTSIVEIKRVYDDHNITFNDKEELRTISKGATTHFLFLDNNGKQDSGKWHIDTTLG